MPTHGEALAATPASEEILMLFWRVKGLVPLSPGLFTFASVLLYFMRLTLDFSHQKKTV